MGESREKQFFDALNSDARAEDSDELSGAAASPAPAQTAPRGWQPAGSNPPEQFAGRGGGHDPASGKHHGDGAGSDAGADPVPGGERGNPQQGHVEHDGRGPGAEMLPPPQDAGTGPQAMVGLTGQQPRDPADFTGSSGPAPAPSSEQYPLRSHGSPMPVPPEERTQVISRDVIREATSRTATGRPGGLAPSPPQRRRPPTEPDTARGPRPPSWDWQGSSSRGADGSELRSEQISASELNAPRRIASSRGWRKWLYYGTFKKINTGESPDEQQLRNLNATVGGHLRGTYSVVVLGGKGGVGKTTTTAAVGSTFASLRNDKTIAIDANPDRASNLADRIDPKATDSFKEVLADPHLQRYSDIRSHVGQNDPAGLDVLGNRYQADRPPLTARTYGDTHERLQRFYSVLISDSGTDVDHPVFNGLMGRADALIMVASTAPDGAKGAAELMDWAYEAGYHRLLQRTVVVINDVRGGTGKAHRALVTSLVEKFSRWVGDQRVFVVPFDPHIASAGVIDLNELRPPTRRRFLEITAKVAGGFNSSEDPR